MAIVHEIEKLAPQINGPRDPNSWVRVHFGLWIEGSYTGSFTKYTQSKKYITRNKGSNVKMRMFVIRNFTEMIASEYGCSYSHAQKCIKRLADKETLAGFTQALITDAIEQFN